MNILALDFDGVVADSQYEALYTSFHAYINLTKKTRLLCYTAGYGWPS